MYLFKTKVDALMIAGVILGLIVGCSNSGPTGSTEKYDPNTVSYNNIYGEWEGSMPYNEWAQDQFEGDSLHVPHFGIYKKKAAQGDSIGYIKFHNEEEYCKGTLYAADKSSDSISVSIQELQAYGPGYCNSSGYMAHMEYLKTNNREYIRWYEQNATEVGRLYPKQ